MQNLLKNCRICPRECNSNRLLHPGLCGASDQVIAAKAFLHKWEEPCISGFRGSGTVFFTGCNMKCVFCQNHDISHSYKGKEISTERLSDIFMELQSAGAHNINLVSPTPYALQIIEAALAAKAKGLTIPIIYNTNGYEKTETIELLKGTVDIYLPDIKYFNDDKAYKYSGVSNYFKYAAAAVTAMVDQVGYPTFDEDGMLTKGVMIRHLILPGQLDESKKILYWIKENLGLDMFVSLMCQYTPMFNAAKYDDINRKLFEEEYDEIVDYFFSIGLENGFAQELDSATSDYTPDFDSSGI